MGKVKAKIEMYTKNYCPYCVNAKALFERKGATFFEYNLDQRPELVAGMQERNPGARTVPQIFINNEAIGGFDQLNALDKKGELDDMLETPPGEDDDSDGGQS